MYGYKNVPITDELVIDLGEEPHKKEFYLPALFKYDKNQRRRYWQIGFQAKSKSASKGLLLSYGGLSTGKIRLTERKVATNKSNRSIITQGWSEAKSKHEKKISEGYTLKGQEHNAVFQPMSGHEYKRKQHNIEKWEHGCGAQVKVDGVRAIVNFVAADIRFTSRKGHELKHLEHLTDSLLEFQNFLPKKVRLDGEIYEHGRGMATIGGYLHRDKRSKKVDKFCYYVFDIKLSSKMDDKGYAYRHSLLTKAYQNYCESLSSKKKANCQVFVLGLNVIHTEEEMQELYSQMLMQGYEGIMLKRLKGKDSAYVEGRSNTFYKLKEFHDQEVTVTGVRASKANDSSAVLLAEDDEGQQLSVNFKTTLEERKSWLAEPELVIGKRLNIKYQKTKGYSKPRFPVGTGFVYDKPIPKKK